MSDDKPRNLARKLVDVMSQVKDIEKDGWNEAQKYKFVEQSAVMTMLRPLLAAAGVIVIPKITRTTYARETTSKYGNVTAIVQCDMAFTLINADDPSDCIADIPWSAEGGDQGDKAVNKAGTSGEKFFLKRLFLLSEKDPDAESVGGDGAGAKARANAPIRRAEPARQPAPRPTPPPARTAATPAGGATTPTAQAPSFAAQAAEGIAAAHEESVAALKEKVRTAAREDGYTLEKWSDWRQLGARLDVGDPGADPATLTTGWCGLVLNRLKASAVR